MGLSSKIELIFTFSFLSFGENNNMKKFVSLFALSVLFAGCASVSVSDEKLLDKAETATGVVKSNLTVVPGSKEASGMDLYFRVQDKQSNIYKCYYAKAMFSESDAVCTKLTSDGKEEKNAGNCNELLKAAGKC